jgi:hypothetical protein
MSEHASVALGYFPIVQEVTEECSSRLSSYDLEGFQTCMSVQESLNSHLREFNQNAKPEFERVLGTALP